MILADTSALYAHLDGDDRNHRRATAELESIRTLGEQLVAHSYVISETSALVQRRLGQAAVVDFHATFEGLLSIVWIDEGVHREAVGALAASGRGAVSLVDHTSFVLMRRLGIAEAFAFDPHFVEQGFQLRPG